MIYNNDQLFFIVLLVLDSGLFRHHFKETALERCHELPDTYLSSPSCPSCAWNNLQQCPTLLHCSSSSWFWAVSTPFQRNCPWKVRSLIPICQALAAQAVHETIYNNVQLFFILLLVLDSGLFRHHFKETVLERCHELPDTYLSSPSCPSCAWNNLQQCPTLLHCSSSSWFWVVSTPFQRNCSWKVPRAPWYLFVKP